MNHTGDNTLALAAWAAGDYPFPLAIHSSKRYFVGTYSTVGTYANTGTHMVTVAAESVVVCD